MTTRRAVLQAVTASLGAATLSSWAALDASERLLPSATDLRHSLEMALKQRQPLVVLATLHACPFCKVARENYLLPAVKAGAVVTQVHFLSPMPIVDGAGRTTTHGQWVKDCQIEVAPTILFFGAQATEVAPRLTAGSTSDFYGAYLDDRLAQARQAVR